jgi:hypothetical protein
MHIITVVRELPPALRVFGCSCRVLSLFGNELSGSAPSTFGSLAQLT